MRKRLFDIIEPAHQNLLSKIYDIFIMLMIVLSVIPLAFKETNTLFTVLEYVTVTVFTVDYLLRLFTADFKLGGSVGSFFVYPITPMALIDLLSILPSITLVNSGFRLLKIFRLLRALRVFRTFKFLRYSKSFTITTIKSRNSKDFDRKSLICEQISKMKFVDFC